MEDGKHQMEADENEKTEKEVVDLMVGVVDEPGEEARVC